MQGDPDQDKQVLGGERRAGIALGLEGPPPAGRWLLALSVLVVLSIAGLRAWVGLDGVRAYPHDAFVLLDGALRLRAGQVPHQDFYSGLGPLAYLPTVAGIALASGGAQGLAYGQALAGGLIGLWGLALSAQRLRPWLALLVAVTLTLMTVAPLVHGKPALRTTPGMTYNRLAYGLIALVLIESLGRAAGGRTRAQALGGASTGFILGSLTFLKISSFGIAALLVAALLVCRPQTRARWSGLVLGWTVASTGWIVALDGHLCAMYSDLLLCSKTKQFHPVLGSATLRDAWLTLGLTVAAALVAARRGWRSSARVMLAGLAVAAASAMLLVANFQAGRWPLAAIFGWLVVEDLGVLTRTRAAWLQVGAMALALLLGAGLVREDLLALVAPLQRRAQVHDSSPASFDAAVLAGFRTADAPYVALVNDGLSLLRTHLRPGDTVATLEFSNPFPFALGLAPARGGATWLQFGNNLTDRLGPGPERILAGATLAMLPKDSPESSLDLRVPHAFAPYVAQHFALVAESQSWKLFRRPAAAH